MLAADVTGAGPRLVLLHGFTQTGRSWGRLPARLAGHHEVVTVDLPGHGRSSSVAADLWATARLVAEAGGRADYLGYSMGGRVALHLALARPDLVERLVLVGATAGIDSAADRAERRAADEVLAAGIERDGVDAFIERWLAGPLFATLPRDAAALESRRENTAAGLASSLRAAGTGTQEPLWGRLGAITAPVLLVVGERDARFTLLAERMQRAWGGPAEIASIPGAGHAAHLEQPDAFAQAVERFLHGHHHASPAASSSP